MHGLPSASQLGNDSSFAEVLLGVADMLRAAADSLLTAPGGAPVSERRVAIERARNLLAAPQSYPFSLWMLEEAEDLVAWLEGPEAESPTQVETRLNLTRQRILELGQRVDEFRRASSRSR